MIIWISAGRVDQHRIAMQAPTESARQRDRTVRHDQVDTEQPGKGGELLGRPGPFAIGGDDQRRATSHDAPCGELDQRERFARAGSAYEQQRSFRAVQSPGKAESPCQHVGQRPGDEERGQFRCYAMPGERCRDIRARRGGRCCFLRKIIECRSDLDAIAGPAIGKDQRVRAKLGADHPHRLGHIGRAVILQAHRAPK